MDPLVGVYETVYNGTGKYKSVSSFILKDGSIQSGLAYKFRVRGSYANGYTDWSSETTVYACSTPTGLAPPILVSSTSISMSLAWS